MDLHVAIILGSTREGRHGERVARWVERVAAARTDFAIELLDLRDFPLPYYPHPKPPKLLEGSYTDDVQRRWVEAVSRADGFIVVTPEYNHGCPAVLKNALDFAYAGWNRKPVAFASYGGVSGGIRAVQQLRQVVIELQMAPIRAEVNIPFVSRAFDANGEPVDELVPKRAAAMVDDLAWWTRVLKEGRASYPG